MTTSLKRFLALLLIVLVQLVFVSPQKAYAATSPDLGAAGSFSVLGGETVTNTGPSTIAGDLGVSPGSAVTGFPPGIVTLPYTIHAADTVTHDAQIANSAAFDFLDTQGCTETYPTGIKDLTGLSLVPGVYCADAFTLTGTLTLSGSNTDVWIFKSASTLITSGTAEVVGPPDACYVWWRVVSSATLGTGTKFIGNILASTSIWLRTGASLLGRAFAYTGEVTLDNNTIGAAICLAPPAPTPTATPTPEVTSAPTSEVTPTPTPAPTSEVTPTPTPQVLGAITTLAVTGSSDQLIRIMMGVVAAFVIFLLGQALLRRNETS